ncbi:MAG: hypothetical protein JXA30_11910 [Deltaproteobacteria bacterium]|nr:hypothetical protein [Deltaproteobacteria bacterium]
MARFIIYFMLVLSLAVVGRPNVSRAGQDDSEAASRASIRSCGNIHIEASAECELIPPSADCEIECTPVAIEAACDAKLALECEGDCDLSASVDCTGECQANCEADCEVEPGEFDCAADCSADCYASCEGHCEADEDSASCRGRCEASCDASCDAECDVELPSADCEAGCEASCNGSCEAEANFDCQIECQGEAYADCELDMQGGCEAACKTEEGALFCDGSYVDYGDNLDECVAALKAALDIRVEAYGEAGCEGGSCSAEGGFSCECSTAPGRNNELPVWATLSLALGLIFAIRRKISLDR